MKFKLVLNKEFEIDTDRDWGGDLEMLYEHLDAVGIAPGDKADADYIHDAIKSMLGNDIDSVVNLDLDETDFEVSIPAETTVEVPDVKEEEDK